MAIFSVIIVTAAPAGQAGEAGGAFVKIEGREIVLKSVELFLNRDNVKQIQVVVLPDELEEAKRKLGPHLGLFGVKMLGGGPRWMDQLAAASEKISPETTHVIVHDGARPAVAYSDIDAIMEAAEKHPAVTLATPAHTPMIEIDEGGNAMAIRSAQEFMHLLTPQAFSKAKFVEMAGAKKDLHPSEMTIVKGSPLNVRVGGPGDVTLVQAMLRMLPKPKVKPLNSPFEEAQW